MMGDEVLMEFIKPNGDVGRVKVKKDLVEAHKYVGYKVVKEEKKEGEKKS